MPASAQLHWTVWVSAVTAATQRLLPLYKHGAGRGRWGLARQLQQQIGLCKVLCWLPLIASRNTPFLCSPHRATRTTDGDRPSTRCHIASTVAYLGSLAYCATLCGAFDRDHWSRSAADDVMIVDHFVQWSRQALLHSICFRFSVMEFLSVWTVYCYILWAPNFYVALAQMTACYAIISGTNLHLAALRANERVRAPLVNLITENGIHCSTW